MSDCIFCKIVAGEIPSNKVYEDSRFLAFLDINPVNPGHTLVIPKKHFSDFLSVPDEVVGQLFVVVKKIAGAAQKGLGISGFNLGINNGEVAGQVVGHLHIHIMPRSAGDGHRLWSGKPYADGEATQIAEEIKGAF